jgi:hypothetical protein
MFGPGTYFENEQIVMSGDRNDNPHIMTRVKPEHKTSPVWSMQQTVNDIWQMFYNRTCTLLKLS